MGTVLAMAAATVAAVMLTLSRVFGLRRVVKYGVLVDVAFTIGAVVMFAGTLTGTLIAVISGLMLAMVLWVMKLLSGALAVLNKPATLDDDWEPKYGWDKL